MTDKRELFLTNAVLSLVVGEAHSVRSGMPVFSPLATKVERTRFSIALCVALDDLETTYNSGVSEAEHLQNIEMLANSLSVMHGPALYGGRYKIGIAQRALNLCLKYWWCMDRIPCPPHCPFDEKMITELRSKGYSCPDWTELDIM